VDHTDTYTRTPVPGSRIACKDLLDTGYTLRYPQSRKGLRNNGLACSKIVRCNVLECHEGVVILSFVCAEPTSSRTQKQDVDFMHCL